MIGTRQTLTSCRIGLVALVMLILTACSNGGSSDPTTASSALALSGSVGDGPVANAEITFEDANGVVVGSTTSDASAKYVFEIPQGTLLPLTVRASGGMDMVTGRELDFDLVAVANVDADATVNLTPQTTLTVAAARCLDNNLTADGLKQTWHATRGQIGMGMDAELLPDPMTQAIDQDNAANVVLATEALGEVVRRTVTALNQGSTDPVDGDEVIAELGCDLAYGSKIDGFSAEGLVRSGAVYRASEAAVLVEVIAGDLQVDGASAMALMDQAVSNIIEAGTVAPSISEVPLDDSLIDQALESVLLVQSTNSSDVVLLGLVDVLVDSQPAELRASMRSKLNAEVSGSFGEVSSALANSSLAAANEFAISATQQTSRQAPYISITADDNSLVQGQSTKVSWASSSADRCLASGMDDWEGPVSLSGRFVVENLQHSTQFELRCYGAGGTNRAAIKVLVSNDSGQSIDDPLDIAQGSGGGSDNGSTSGADDNPTDSGNNGSSPGDTVADNGGGSVDNGNTSGGTGGGGTVVKPVAPDTSVSLRASATRVPQGDFVTLNWSTSNANACTAASGWSGSKGDAGSAQVGPIVARTTFVLTCDGAAGETTSSVTVNLQSPVVVAWQAPEENVDGTPIQSLSGYRIFVGETPGSYDNETVVDDPSATQVELNLDPGSYYLAMTAVSADGTASELSNEIIIRSW